MLAPPMGLFIMRGYDGHVYARTVREEVMPRKLMTHV
jgi:hypothetical protein